MNWSFIRIFRFTILFVTLLVSCIAEHGSLTQPVDRPYGTDTCNVVFKVGLNDGVLPGELIHSLRLVVVKRTESTHIVAEVVDRVGLDNVDRVECGLTLTEGVYNIYAFANFEILRDSNAVTTNKIYSLKKGDELNLPEFESYVITLPHSPNSAVLDLVSADNKLFLPMSGKLNSVVIRRNDDLFFNVDLYRMMCRVELTLHNPNSTELTIDNLKLGKFYTERIFILPPEYVDDINSDPNLPPGLSQKVSFIDFNSILDDRVYTERKITMPTLYVNESVCDGGFILEADISRIQSDQIQQPVVKEKVKLQLARCALMRNSRFIIDVLLHRYKFDIVSVMANPPIGGYPPMVERGIDDFTCTFEYAGPFVIQTEMRRYGNAVSDNGEPVEVQLDSMKFEDNDNIFTKEPVYIPETGLIKNGQLGYNTGRAVITLYFRVKQPLFPDHKAAEAERLMSVKINIVRK